MRWRRGETADDTNNGGAAGAQDEVLIRWTGWLDAFIGGLSALPGETATDFCCAAADEWQRSLMEDADTDEELRTEAADAAPFLLTAELLGNLANHVTRERDARRDFPRVGCRGGRRR
jgi:hypothetical protein